MKIWMIGSVVSGKTTLARKWQKELGIPYFEDETELAPF